MGWIILLLILVIVVVAILFLNRFYVKATRETALVRTGLGGQRVVLDGGALSLPIVHRVAEVNMKTMRLEVERTGEKSIITKDRLRIDATAEFYVRVQPSDDGVATAAQALGGKVRASDVEDLLEGKLVDALLSVAATYTMDELQDNRGRYVAEVTGALADRVAANGLVLEAVSLTRLDQTPFASLDQNNAFNAVGMRRLAEVIATNRRERAEIEDAADVAVRQSHLDATKRKLVIEQEEEEAQLAQSLSIESQRARTMAETAERQSEAEERREYARIRRDMEVRAKQIQSDREIDELSLQSRLAVQTARADTEIKLAAKTSEEAVAAAAAQTAIADEAAAREGVETAREKATAERVKALAIIKAEEEAAVDDTRVASEASTVRAMAAAEAEATRTKADAIKAELLAKAEGESALYAAENAQSDAIIKMKLDLAKVEALPEVVREMVRPAEKIDSIRINHVSGFGPVAGGGGGGGGGDGPMVNQVVDGILSMALQLPAVQKLGEDIGMNISGSMDRVTSGLTGGRPGKASGKDGTTSEAAE
ncbi:flotillin family protein [Acuticoccus sediminis]|uniref:flotillin family protein n=1 Tax=Acuticoccus sediminis TaxID=2184697 RepID=UPI0011B93868|nr:flotillin domain-containing protein [Acuticoccus sediminis]